MSVSGLRRPRGSRPNVNSTRFSMMSPTAIVAISHDSEPRFTKGRTAVRSTSMPKAAQIATATSMAAHAGQCRWLPKANTRTAPSMSGTPWAKLTVREVA